MTIKPSALQGAFNHRLGLASILFFGFLMLAPVGSDADVPACSLTDACGSSSYQWVHYSCVVQGAGSRCYEIMRMYCDGTTPPTFRYKLGESAGAVPCSDDCVSNAYCTEPGGGGGNG